MKVLVVEDDPETRSMLTDYLSVRGHDVTAAPDAEEGWEVWQAQHFPLVVLDWALPGMDGLALCRRLRENPAGDTSFVLMTTGSDRPNHIATILEAGANDFVRKPFSLELLDVRLTFAERQVAEMMERKTAQEELTHKALHDTLTDLPNRDLFWDRLEQAITLGERNESPVSLLILDLDGFKQVNDTFGHPLGDEVLKAVGLRLRSTLRASDTLARLGGDEFGLVLPATDSSGAGSVAQKVLGAFGEHFLVDGHGVALGASVGIAVYPVHARDSHTLVERADSAMYRAKRSGTGAFRFYDSN